MFERGQVRKQKDFLLIQDLANLIQRCVSLRVATKIFEGFIIGQEPVSIALTIGLDSVSCSPPHISYTMSQALLFTPKVATKSWIQNQRPSPKL